ncbi:5947_t:CDS:2 [Entrophospora sp. SA101]|nr:5947_t:CDS:2 [Entrophospora sp. SA101]
MLENYFNELRNQINNNENSSDMTTISLLQENENILELIHKYIASIREEIEIMDHDNEINANTRKDLGKNNFSENDKLYNDQ